MTVSALIYKQPSLSIHKPESTSGWLFLSLRVKSKHQFSWYASTGSRSHVTSRSCLTCLVKRDISSPWTHHRKTSGMSDPHGSVPTQVSFSVSTSLCTELWCHSRSPITWLVCYFLAVGKFGAIDYRRFPRFNPLRGCRKQMRIYCLDISHSF